LWVGEGLWAGVESNGGGEWSRMGGSGVEPPTPRRGAATREGEACDPVFAGGYARAGGTVTPRGGGHGRLSHLKADWAAMVPEEKQPWMR